MAPVEGRVQYIPQEIKDSLAAWVIEIRGFNIPLYKDALINKMKRIIVVTAHQANFKEVVVGNNWYLHFIRTYNIKVILKIEAITDLKMDWVKWESYENVNKYYEGIVTNIVNYNIGIWNPYYKYPWDGIKAHRHGTFPNMVIIRPPD